MFTFELINSPLAGVRNELFQWWQALPLRKETREDRRCTKCDAEPRLIHRMLDPRTGKTIRMFECKCGTRTWDE
jgi:hypothetical protein